MECAALNLCFSRIVLPSTSMDKSAILTVTFGVSDSKYCYEPKKVAIIVGPTDTVVPTNLQFADLK